MKAVAFSVVLLFLVIQPIRSDSTPTPKEQAMIKPLTEASKAEIAHTISSFLRPAVHTIARAVALNLATDMVTGFSRVSYIGHVPKALDDQDPLSTTKIDNMLFDETEANNVKKAPLEITPLLLRSALLNLKELGSLRPTQ